MYTCLLRVTWITTNHPKLSDTGNSEDAYQALRSAMKEESVSIPQEQIDEVCSSIYAKHVLWTSQPSFKGSKLSLKQEDC